MSPSPSFWPRARRGAASFWQAQGGSAVVEFALIMPVLLMLYLGSIEASSLFTVDRRVTLAASTVGDLVAQWNPDVGEIPQAVLDDYFGAAEAIMVPYDATGIQQVVSFVTVDAAGATTVLWSKASGGAAARQAGEAYPLDAATQMNQLARAGGQFIAAETTLGYKPVLGLAFSDPLSLNHVSYFLPRFGKCIDAAGSDACP